MGKDETHKNMHKVPGLLEDIPVTQSVCSWKTCDCFVAWKEPILSTYNIWALCHGHPMSMFLVF